jgi:hypothetical protein
MKFNFDKFKPKSPYAFNPAYTMPQIMLRIEEATETMRRLPPVRARGFVCHWPAIVREYWEAYGQDIEEVRLGPPTSRAITEADEVSEWLKLVDGVYEKKLLWLRSSGNPLKKKYWTWGRLKKVFQKSERTLQNDYAAAIFEIYQKISVR